MNAFHPLDQLGRCVGAASLPSAFCSVDVRCVFAFLSELVYDRHYRCP